MRKASSLIFIVCLFLFILPGCVRRAPAKVEEPVKKSPYSGDLEKLAEWLTGSFSSASQAAADDDYYDIRLHMVRIWAERSDGIWLYVEQAVAGQPPYRQRVYRLTQLSDDLFESRVYEIEDPERYAGGWKNPEALEGLLPAFIDLREGCAIVLREVNEEKFVGNTVGKTCASDLHGASYATSEVVVEEKRMISWDRGFDETGSQIWGAEKGGYVFDKTINFRLDNL